MISVCYSVDRARRYFWVYHLFGWLVPILATIVVYLLTRTEKSTDDALLKAKTLEIDSDIVSIVTLAICIMVILVSLLRFIRRRYQLNRTDQEQRRSSILINETQPLLQDEREIESSHGTTPSTSSSNDLFPSISSICIYCSCKTIGTQCTTITPCFPSRCNVYQYDCRKFVGFFYLSKLRCDLFSSVL